MQSGRGFIYGYETPHQESAVPIPKKVADRLAGGLKRFKPVLEAAKDRDVNESDTSMIVTDMLAEVFGFDKYAEVTREYAIRGTFCDLATKIEAAEALTYRACERYNDEKYVKREAVSFETTKLISMAKVFVGDMISEVADQMLQFHGGAGYIEEYRIARAWRDQRLFRIGGGTSETMRYYIAKIMGL